MRKSIAFAVLLALSACDNDASVASHNLSKAADNFEIDRRVILYNGFTNDYILVVEGRCALGSGTSARSVTITCKTGPAAYKKHIAGLSDNTLVFVEQLEAAAASVYHYRVTFKPAVLLPAIDIR